MEYDNSMDYSLGVYTKGALMFDEIRESVGDEKFFEVLQNYYEAYKYQNVNSEKFEKFWADEGVDLSYINFNNN